MYYSYFDTAANRYLIEEGGLDISDGSIVGFVVNSGCEYHAPITYPESIEAGVRVDKLGNSSVQYGIAIFKAGEQEAAAHGHFVHVFVERAQNRSVPIPQNLRVALERLRE
jgi:acyl-CoA thioester hydrolase|tara:strand:- start:107 stop:439 length:333 start_codon:yes stop_codon:yes gene_type:complete